MSSACIPAYVMYFPVCSRAEFETYLGHHHFISFVEVVHLPLQDRNRHEFVIEFSINCPDVYQLIKT